MSFISMGTPRLVAQNPSGEITSGYWVGKGGDAGYYVYQFDGKWVMSTLFGPGWKDDAGDVFSPNYAIVNGQVFFESDGYYLFYDLAFGWIIKPNLAPGYEKFACSDESDASTGHYQGAEFWSGELADGEIFNERGYERGSVQGLYAGSQITLSAYFPRFESDSQFGEYLAAGGESGSRFFGVPRWINGSAKYERSATKTDGRYSYGSIRWIDAAGVYALGSYGSSKGWLQSASAPEPGSDWTLSFAAPDDSDATGSSVLLSWDAWAEGSETGEVLLINSVGFQS